MVEEDKATLTAIGKEATDRKFVLPELLDLATRLDKLNFVASGNEREVGNLEKALLNESVEVLMRWAAARNRKVCPGPPWLLFVQLKQLNDRLEDERRTFVDQALLFSERILKDLKPSMSTSNDEEGGLPEILRKFCRTRILLPLFPISLHEPMEQLRTLLEKRHGDKYRLETGFLGERRLESCAVVAKSGGVVFKAATRPGKSLFETSDSEKLSSAFKKRMSGNGTAPNARKIAERIMKRVNEFPALWELLQGEKTIGNLSEIWPNVVVGSLMAALDISEEEAMKVEKLHLSVGIDQIELYSYFDRFVRTLGRIQQDPLFSEKLLPQIRSRPLLKFPSTAAVSKTPALMLPTLQPPPGISVLGCLWTGRLGGEMEVSVLPLSKAEGVSEIGEKLREVEELAYEGMLSMTKFRAHYEKAVNSRKRSLIHCVVGSKEWDKYKDISDHLFNVEQPHALAFTTTIESEKFKIWLVPPEGSRFVTGLIDVNNSLTKNSTILARPTIGIFEEIENLLAKNLINKFPFSSIYWDCPEISTRPIPPARPVAAVPAAVPTAVPTAVPAAASLSALLASFKGGAGADTAQQQMQQTESGNFQQAAAALREALSRKPQNPTVAVLPTVYIGNNNNQQQQQVQTTGFGKTCYRFNSGYCDFGEDKCRYVHACNICGGGHPETEHEQSTSTRRGWRNM
jgi:hypothetical protein